MTVTQQSLMTTMFFKMWRSPFCCPWENQIPSANRICWGSSRPLFCHTTASPEHRAEREAPDTHYLLLQNPRWRYLIRGKEEEKCGIHVVGTTVTTVKEFFLFMICKILISDDQASSLERWVIGAYLTQGHKSSHILEAATK